MAHQAASDISRPPPQLLARFLQHAGPQERLGTCTVVSKAFHAAAIMATSHIAIQGCTGKRCKSLSTWLQSNAALAAVSSINMGSAASSLFQEPMPQLLLPLPQLQDLRQLSCTKLLLAAAAQSHTAADTTADGPAAPVDDATGEATPTPILTPALSALTHLQLLSCRVKLDGLHHLTALQHLHYVPPPKDIDTDDSSSTAMSVLAEALPQLQHLTHLELGMVPVDAVLCRMSSLQHLLQLRLHRVSCSADSSSHWQLPASLQQLQMWFNLDLNKDLIIIGPDTTPRICQLSQLQELTVMCAIFTTTTLAPLISLAKLDLDAVRIHGAPGDDDENRLQALTEHKHLQLRHIGLGGQLFTDFGVSSPPLSGLEAAALTGPSMLTSLVLDAGYRRLQTPEDYTAMFSANRQMPGLLHLRVCCEMLGSPDAVRQLVACCPNLQTLECRFGDSDHDDEVRDEDEEAPEAGAVTASLKHLAGLKQLERLEISDKDLHIGYEGYKALGALTCLRELRLLSRRAYNLYGLMQLTRCKQLSYVSVFSWLTGADDPLIGFALKEEPCEAPIWRRLAGAVLSMVDEVLFEAPEDQRALRCLVHTAKAVYAHELDLLQQQLCEQQQQHQATTHWLHRRLKQQAAHFRASLKAQERDYQVQISALCQRQHESQQQVVQLQQQVATLQAALEEVLGRKL